MKIVLVLCCLPVLLCCSGATPSGAPPPAANLTVPSRRDLRTTPPPCLPGMAKTLRNPVLQRDGSVLAEGITYPVGLHWQEDQVYLGCPCNVTTCLRLCPASYFAGNDATNSSEPVEVEEFPDHGDAEPFQLEVVDEDNMTQTVLSTDHFHVFTGAMCVGDRASLLEPLEYPMDTYRILKNGSIHYTVMEKVRGADHFCVYNSPEGLLAVICLPEPQNAITEPAMSHKIYPYFMLVSVVFLGFTLLAYALAPDMKNLHGRCQMAHAATLLGGFLGLAMIQLTGTWAHDSACYTLVHVSKWSVPAALITFYFLLSSFFWLNVLCFDIWWTFRGIRKMAGSRPWMSPMNSVNRKLALYCMYAFGVPLICGIIILAVDNSYKVEPHLKPGIGLYSCWFQDKLTTFIYFNGYVSVLLCMNMFFFISTTVQLLQLRRETSVLKRGDSRTHSAAQRAQDKQRLQLYFKLFLVMGVTWVMEIISWLVGGHESYWFVTDIVNTLQGVAIFVVCVWFTRLRDSCLGRLLPATAAGRLAYSKSHRTAPSAHTKSSEAMTETIHSTVSHQNKPYALKPLATDNGNNLD